MFRGSDLPPLWPAIIVVGLIGYAVTRLAEWFLSHLTIGWN